LIAILSELRHFNESLVANFINKLSPSSGCRRGGRAGRSEPSEAVDGFVTTSVPVAEGPPPRQIGGRPIPIGGLMRDEFVFSHDRYRSKEDVKSCRMMVRTARRRAENRSEYGSECSRRSRLGRYRRHRRRARPGPEVDRSRDLSPEVEPHTVVKLTSRAG
jgi:hypothetical protein